MKKAYLANVAPEKAFWVNNGSIIHNLAELAAALKQMSAQQFAHHVSKEKNDFASWVRDVVGDHAIAKKLSGLKTKAAAAKAVTARVAQLGRK